MKMGNLFKKYVIAWAVLVVIFNVIVFAVPSQIAGMSKFDGAFWSGYALIMLTLIGQLVCADFAFKAQTAEKLFLNLPLLTISYSALIISVICGALCMAIPNVPNWVGIVLCALMLGFAAIAVIKASAAAELVEDTGKRVKEQTLFIKLLTADAESLMAKAKDDEAKAATRKVYEAVRYSDPMSVEALSGLEMQITLKFREFEQAVADGTATAGRLADETAILLDERNKKCKVLK